MKLRRVAFLAMLAGTACAAAVATLVVGRFVAPASASGLAPPQGCMATQADCVVEEVVRRFVATAVERQDPEASFDLVAPELHQGLTKAQWATGYIPIVPVQDVDWATSSLRFSDTAGGVRYYILRVRSNQLASEVEFWIGLTRRRDRWLVSYFAPAAKYGPPSSQ